MKLKPLHRILNENPSYTIDNDGCISHRNWRSVIMPHEMKRFGEELGDQPGFVTDPCWIEGDESQKRDHVIERFGYTTTSRKLPGVKIETYAQVLTKEEIAAHQAQGIHVTRNPDWDEKR